jgi:hypothetical protein
MLFHPPFSPPLINEDLPAGPQLVFTLNNRFFRHQAGYSLLPAKPGGQADCVISLCKYKVVGYNVQYSTECVITGGMKYAVFAYSMLEGIHRAKGRGDLPI